MRARLLATLAISLLSAACQAPADPGAPLESFSAGPASSRAKAYLGLTSRACEACNSYDLEPGHDS
jgi:hypothetical protein